VTENALLSGGFLFILLIEWNCDDQSQDMSTPPPNDEIITDTVNIEPNIYPEVSLDQIISLYMLHLSFRLRK